MKIKWIIVCLSMLFCFDMKAKAEEVNCQKVEQEVQALLTKCVSPKWQKDQLYSDAEMIEITNEENECLKAELQKLINQNFLLAKQQKPKEKLLQAIDILQQSYQNTYFALANQSSRCIESEEDIFSCGTAAKMIPSALWQKQLQELIRFTYDYSRGC